MKTKHSFIANSSTASFIISGKEPPKITIDLIPVCLTVNNEEELKKYLGEFFGYDDINETIYATSLYERCLVEINNGNTLYFGDICSEDGGLSEFIFDEGTLKHFKNHNRNFDIIEDVGL